MKRIFLPICIIFFILPSLHSQIELVFTAQYNLFHKQLDSVFVENITQGGDTTLYYPDTTLVLSVAVGTTDLTISSFLLKPCFPNPFEETTSFELYLSKSEPVSVTIYDLLGRVVAQFKNNLNSGKHTFSFSPGSEKFYSILVETPSQKQVLKAVHVGPSNAGCSIECTNMNAISSVHKSTRSGFVWQSGDTLRFTGYVTIGANLKSYEIITDHPIANSFYTFVITDGLPCAAQPLIVDPRDGMTYYTVKLGNQCWMAENLKYLPAVFPADTISLTNPLYYVYDYNGTNVSSAMATMNFSDYGVLYNWSAAMAGSASSSSNPSGIQGVCPSGWHIPSDAEWKELEVFMGMSSGDADASEWRGTNEGGKLKSTSLTFWNLPNTGASNSGNFTGLPGGTCFGTGFFYYIGNTGYFWSSTENTATHSWFRALHYSQSKVYRSYFEKYFGYSVRCVKD